MEFKLGQKVKFKRISKKIDMSENYVSFDDFDDNEEEINVNRRIFDSFSKPIIGYIAGRRRLVDKTTFIMMDGREDDPDYIDIAKQEYMFFYLVAYDMGKTYFVLEEDLKEEDK